MNQQAINTMVPGLKVGEKLGHFEVQQQLASGGHGIVWLGYDRLLSRRVAIKQIATSVDVDEIFREKFRREADLQKRVSTSHPNLVDVIDCVDDPRGLFIVMEYVEGMSLATALNQLSGPVDTLKALKIIRGVAGALTAIHGAGIIHRDLKPGNILLTNDGTAKVCDFGVATLLAEQRTMEAGTAQYMAPEMYSDGPVDARADIYSLGMVAYEVLVGRPAFADNFKAVMRDQRHQAMRWMKWHTNVRVQAPPITQLNPQVPEVLADLVQRMMSKDATQRIATAEQLLEAIHGHFSKSGQRATAVAAARAAAAAATATAPIGGSFDQPTAPLKKTSKLVWALVAIFSLQGIFFGGYFWAQHRKKLSAVQQKENAARDKYDRAMESFDNNNWTAAQQIFNELAVEYPDGTLGVRCSAYSLVCLARLEMDAADRKLLDSRFDEAMQSYATAAQALETSEEQALRVNAAKLIGRLDDRKKEVGKRQAFIEVARDIDTAINNQQFDTARRRHYELHSKAGVLIDSERRVVSALGIRIEDQQQNQLLATDLAEARRLFEAGRRVEARQTILDAIDRHGNKTVLTDLMGTVDTDINYRNSLTAATDAENGGQLDEAVVAYLRVNAIRPDKKWTDKIADLRSRKAFAVGQDFEASGNIPAAAQKYREADNFKEHPQARARLKALKMEGERSDFIRDGEALVSAGNYQAAIAAFQRAQGISQDPDVAQKIQRAQVRLHVKEAVAQLNLGKMDEGQALLQKALAIDPNDPQAVNYMDQIKIRTRLTQLGAEGDDLRNKSKFSRAKSSYKSAIALAKENALTNAQKKYEQRLFETEFDHLIAQSRNAMELSLWTQAKAFISTAKKMRPDDPRLPKLEFEINEKAPKDS